MVESVFFAEWLHKGIRVKLSKIGLAKSNLVRDDAESEGGGAGWGQVSGIGVLGDAWVWRVCGGMKDGMRQNVGGHGEGVGQVGRPGARRVRGGAPRGRRREGHGRVKREEVRFVGSRVG